jgi:hypothetical protein
MSIYGTLLVVIEMPHAFCYMKYKKKTTHPKQKHSITNKQIQKQTRKNKKQNSGIG